MDETALQHKWIILCSSFLCIFLGTSLGYSSGVIHVALLEKYEESVTVTAWLGALFSSTFSLLAPIGSAVVNRLDSRFCVVIGCILNLAGFTLSAFSPNFYFLFLSYGILAGAGQAFENVGTVVTIAYYFAKQRTLATGISLAGVGLGVIVFPPLTQHLIYQYGINGAFLILGAIAFQSCVSAFLLRPHHSERKRQKFFNLAGSETNLPKFRLMCKGFVYHVGLMSNPPFLTLCFSIILWSSGVNICVLFLPNYFISTGSPNFEASYIMSIFGLGSVFSRLLTGLAAVDGGIDSKILYFGSYGVIGILTLCFPLFGAYFYGKVAYAFLLGLYTAGTFVLLSQLAIDVVGKEKFVSAVGVEYFMTGIGFLAGPTLSGRLLKLFGYNVLFVIVGCLFLLTCCLGIGMMLLLPKEEIDVSETDLKIKLGEQSNAIMTDELELFVLEKE